MVLRCPRLHCGGQMLVSSAPGSALYVPTVGAMSLACSLCGVEATWHPDECPPRLQAVPRLSDADALTLRKNPGYSLAHRGLDGRAS